MECKFKQSERFGLYILIIIILLHTCSLDTKKIDDKLDELNAKMIQIEQKIKK